MTCIIIDVIGTSSELLPFIGEVTDVVYAPVAALALRSLFQGSNVVFALEFLEEFLPFTDILPLATICWIVQTYYGDSSIAKNLGIGVYGRDAVQDGISIYSNEDDADFLKRGGRVIDAQVMDEQNRNNERK